MPSSSAARRLGSTPSGADAAPGPVTVARLGSDGDGVADAPDGRPLYVPLTLPGERVQPGPLQRRGDAWTADATVLDPSPDRVAPPCRHFGPCGGCTVQHLADDAYAAWKRSALADTLARLGFTGPLPPLARTPPAARRRMDLAIRRENGAVRIGLHMRRSASVVDMAECPVLHPALFAAVQALRPVLRSMSGLKREGSAVMNLLDSGPDLLLRTDAPLTAPDRTRLAALATQCGMPRISWALGDRGEPEPACTLRPPTTAFSGHTTALPPGAFLQASREGEAAIQDAMAAALPALKPRATVAELFAGVGSLTHRIATAARVQAYEGDAEAVRALKAARNPRVTAVQRDLARQPLQAADLQSAAAVVLDPPWGGAREQMPALAASGLPIVYVSCNPAALLRDGRVLTAAGYRVTSAVAIDQFLWSARIEAVVGFRKP